MLLAILLIDLTLAPLVESLSSPRFRIREAAHAHLSRAGAWALPAVVRGVSHADPEVAARCRRLLAAAWTPLREVRDWIARPDLPWVYLDGTYAGRAQEYLRRVSARFAMAPDWPEYLRYREATRVWLVERHRAGDCPRSLLVRLDAMRQAESDWRYRGR